MPGDQPIQTPDEMNEDHLYHVFFFASFLLHLHFSFALSKCDTDSFDSTNTSKGIL